MTRIRAAVLIALSIAQAGCGVMPAETPNLDGTGWRATIVAGSRPAPGMEPTARFDGGTISGSTGCNRYSGEARFDDGKLVVNESAITLAECAEPAASVQKLFLEAIGGTRSIRVEGEFLVIAGPSGDVVLRRDESVR